MLTFWINLETGLQNRCFGQFVVFYSSQSEVCKYILFALKVLLPDKEGEFVKLPASVGHTVVKEEAIKTAFPDLTNTGQCVQCNMLCTLNTAVDDINNTILAALPGEEKMLLSWDTLQDDESHDLSSEEFLNEANAPNVPPHRLFLKENAICMLMRNINLGTRLANNTKVCFWTGSLN